MIFSTLYIFLWEMWICCGLVHYVSLYHCLGSNCLMFSLIWILRLTSWLMPMHIPIISFWSITNSLFLITLYFYSKPASAQNEFRKILCPLESSHHQSSRKESYIRKRISVCLIILLQPSNIFYQYAINSLTHKIQTRYF